MLSEGWHYYRPRSLWKIPLCTHEMRKKRQIINLFFLWNSFYLPDSRKRSWGPSRSVQTILLRTAVIGNWKMIKSLIVTYLHVFDFRKAPPSDVVWKIWTNQKEYLCAYVQRLIFFFVSSYGNSWSLILH